MAEDIGHECGVAALYWLDKAEGPSGRATERVRDGNVSPLIPGLLLDLQNRGQLAAGFSSYHPERDLIISTFKGLGTVTEALRMSHPAKHQSIVEEHAGRAAIGHTRYATCGSDDIRYAQPFERQHGRLWKWFAFAFNGTLSNYEQLRQRLLSKQQYHFALNTDTEMIMHALAHRLRGNRAPKLAHVMSGVAREFDGAYNIAFLDAMGRMFVSRDPLGFRPMSWSVQGSLFGAASESAALRNLGFDEIHALAPGEMVVIEGGRLRTERFATRTRQTRCFFEWVYFANVASEIDGAGIYEARAGTGRRLAELENQQMDEECIVVPVPDTAKAAADAYAYKMSIPCVEGIIRNRYVGRTFIQSDAMRQQSVGSKYTVLPSVLSGKRVFLLEDSIVRSTTLRALAGLIREIGGAAEIHVRVACPPIVAPCFYGIDMSTLSELFAPEFLSGATGRPPEEAFLAMATALSVSSVRYLSVGDMAPCLGVEPGSLCLGCVTGRHPTLHGRRLMRRARENLAKHVAGRTYE